MLLRRRNIISSEPDTTIRFIAGGQGESRWVSTNGKDWERIYNNSGNRSTGLFYYSPSQDIWVLGDAYVGFYAVKEGTEIGTNYVVNNNSRVISSAYDFLGETAVPSSNMVSGNQYCRDGATFSTYTINNNDLWPYRSASNGAATILHGDGSSMVAITTVRAQGTSAVAKYNVGNALGVYYDNGYYFTSFSSTLTFTPASTSPSFTAATSTGYQTVGIFYIGGRWVRIYNVGYYSYSPLTTGWLDQWSTPAKLPYPEEVSSITMSYSSMGGKDKDTLYIMGYSGSSSTRGSWMFSTKDGINWEVNQISKASEENIDYYPVNFAAKGWR